MIKTKESDRGFGSSRYGFDGEEEEEEEDTYAYLEGTEQSEKVTTEERSYLENRQEKMMLKQPQLDGEWLLE